MKSTGRVYYGHMSPLLPSIHTHSQNNRMPLVAARKDRTSGGKCKWFWLPTENIGRGSLLSIGPAQIANLPFFFFFFSLGQKITWLLCLEDLQWRLEIPAVTWSIVFCFLLWLAAPNFWYDAVAVNQFHKRRAILQKGFKVSCLVQSLSN